MPRSRKNTFQNTVKQLSQQKQPILQILSTPICNEYKNTSFNVWKDYEDWEIRTSILGLTIEQLQQPEQLQQDLRILQQQESTNINQKNWEHTYAEWKQNVGWYTLTLPSTIHKHIMKHSLDPFSPMYIPRNRRREWYITLKNKIMLERKNKKLNMQIEVKHAHQKSVK